MSYMRSCTGRHDLVHDWLWLVWQIPWTCLRDFYPEYIADWVCGTFTLDRFVLMILSLICWGMRRIAFEPYKTEACSFVLWLSRFVIWVSSFWLYFCEVALFSCHCLYSNWRKLWPPGTISLHSLGIMLRDWMSCTALLNLALPSGCLDWRCFMPMPSRSVLERFASSLAPQLITYTLP